MTSKTLSLAEFENFISSRTYVDGHKPTTADTFVLSQLGVKPSKEKFPHTARYYEHISKFSAWESSNFTPATVSLQLTGLSSSVASNNSSKNDGPLVQMGSNVFEEGVRKNKHPPWFKPKNGVDLGLLVHNTLTEASGGKQELEPFIPANGRRVLWYTCGPTVYDSCHMGHARAYLTFDILRRITEDYFGYEVLYQINITDIDDKIILRARRNKLIELYCDKLPVFEDKNESNEGGRNPYSYEKDKNAFKTILNDLKQVIVVKEEKMKKKTIEFEKPLPESTPSREKEDFETKKKEHKLKSARFLTTKKRIDLLTKVQENSENDVNKGFQAALEQLKKESGSLGVSVEFDNSKKDDVLYLIETLNKTLNEKIVQIQTELETLQEDQDKNKERIELLENSLGPVDQILTAISSLTDAFKNSFKFALLKAAKDELGEKLDDELGHTITDHNVFNSHARKYEKEYVEDMERLGVREPSVLTRVTEYVDKIIAYIQKIVDNGFAYETAGNVYLDTEAFKSSGHHYKKLKPSSGDTNEDEMAESEGSLGAAGVKKHKNDFALWKSSKRGEPEWESPWGKGRPGWHIECSVVASDILGENIDVHAGGVDLKFPHHDNELAQSEAHTGHHQWVNYFYHAGHLHIKGLKMSKSLKNFITIRQALQEHTARQLRLMFLLQSWDKPMNYSDQTVDDAKKKESTFKNYFSAVESALRQPWLEDTVGWVDREENEKLSNFGFEIQSRVHKAFCTNFDTPAVITALCELISETNKAFNRNAKIAPLTLRQHATYITRILRVLGVVTGADDIGFPAGGDSGGDVKKLVRPYVDAAVQFRDSIRALALKGVDSASILKLCDEFRDVGLVNAGVRVGDTENGKSEWDLDDPKVLQKEINDKRRKQQEAQLNKLSNTIKRKAAELAKIKEGAIEVSQLFKQDNEFSEYDNEGFPTKDKNGEELSKGVTKKLKKQVEAHWKLREQLIEKAGGEDKISSYLKSLEDELSELEKQLEAKN
eukprot:c21337_g2_i1.p1 GENE.c21337_g2_i1~~c21337_g2_i1.p1  ORF type:complete len:1000 (-),score=490.61 c21337_g2_i1:49-3048(-)